MCRKQYSPAIGCRIRTFVCAQYENAGYGYNSANRRAVFLPDHNDSASDSGCPLLVVANCAGQWGEAGGQVWKP